MANKLTVKYNGNNIVNSAEISGNASITYNGSTITTVAAGTTKTLNCNGKYMSTNLVIGGKTLTCKDKIMASNVTVSVASSSVTVNLTGSPDSTYGYITVNGTTYSSATTISVSPGTSVDIYVSGGSTLSKKLCSILLNGETVKSGSGTYTYTANSDCTIEFSTYTLFTTYCTASITT